MQKKTRIVIVGGGFGGVYTLKNLHKFFHHSTKEKKVNITLISEKNYFLFTPLLHEVATGGISPENIVEPIRKVLGCCLDEFHLGRAEKISVDDKTVTLVCGHIIYYDYLVIAPGSETNFYDVPGAKEFSLALKSLEDAVRIKNRIIANIERATRERDSVSRRRMLSFVVAGGGPTGVELVAELSEFIKDTFSRYYKKELIADASITLIQKDRELLPQFKKKIREKSFGVLKKKGVNVMLDAKVVEVGNSYVMVEHPIGKTYGVKKIETKTVIWVAGIKPREICFDTEVTKQKDGRLRTDEYLRLDGYDNIFVLGDGAAFENRKTGTFLPALAQVAEKEAASVAENIYLSIKNGSESDTNSAIAEFVSLGKREKNEIKSLKLKPFFYQHSGDMISLGQWMAVGEIFGFVFSGHIAWFIWRTIYLSKMISFRKKVKVAIDWTVNFFSPRDISEL